MFRRRSKPSDASAHRYDLPRLPAALSDADWVKGIQIYAEHRVPADAFLTILGDGQFPLGYVWPVAFCNHDLGYWTSENLKICVDFS